MKGTLVYSSNKQNWIVEYKEESGREVFLEVEPGRIDELKMVGTFLNNMDIVDFKIKNIDHFPYRFAIPIVNRLEEEKLEPKKKMVQKKRVTLWLSGFHEDEIEIDCEGYDCSSSGYFYFYDKDKNGNRLYIGSYPVQRTIIHKIETIEVEIS